MLLAAQRHQPTPDRIEEDLLSAPTARRRTLGATVAATTALLLAAGCTSNEPPQEENDGGATGQAAGGGTANDEPGDTVVIGFSAPAADHGWMGAITQTALDTAEQLDVLELRQAEATNDVNVQISQVEQFINDGVDAIVLLPFDGAALTPVALQAMEAGIPVVNVDREFSSPFAARATILGDNYGIGVSAGTYICEQLGDNPGAVVAEIQGIASLPSRRTAAKASRTRSATAGSTSTTRSAPTSRCRAARPPPRTSCRPPRGSTPCGTTTTTRASVSWPPSRTLGATSSSWSAAPARST